MGGYLVQLALGGPGDGPAHRRLDWDEAGGEGFGAGGDEVRHGGRFLWVDWLVGRSVPDGLLLDPRLSGVVLWRAVPGRGGAGLVVSSRPRGGGAGRDKKVHSGGGMRDTVGMAPEDESENGVLEGVFALGAGADEVAKRVALEQRVLAELLGLRKATGVLTVQKFGRFETLRLVCGGDDLLDAYLMFQRELERYRHSGRNEAAAALSLSSAADSVLDRLQLTAEALSPGEAWRDQRTARRWSDAGMPVIARDLVYFAQVAGRLGTETLSIQLDGQGTELAVVIDQMTTVGLPTKAPLIQVWHYPDGEEPRQVELDLDHYASTEVRHPDRMMRRYRLLLELPDQAGTAEDCAGEADAESGSDTGGGHLPDRDCLDRQAGSGGQARAIRDDGAARAHEEVLASLAKRQNDDDDVPLLSVSITGRDAPMRSVFFEDHSHLQTRLTTYRSIVTIEVSPADSAGRRD